jgi:hypothetical protein
MQHEQLSGLFLDVLLLRSLMGAEQNVDHISNNIIPNELNNDMHEAEEHLDRVWDILTLCRDLQDPIERDFESEVSDYITGEDFTHREIGYLLDDCDGQPLKFSTLETMLQIHKQYKNPRTRLPILYFTKVQILKG